MSLIDNGNANNNGNSDSWAIWRKHIILELQRLNENLEKLEERSAEYMLRTTLDVSRLKIYAALVGTAFVIFGGIVLKWLILG